MRTARLLYFTAPRRLEVREIRLPALQADEVLVETTCSAVSAGTEMLVYRGEFPRLESLQDGISSDLEFPMAYGYACAGRVREIGSGVDPFWADRAVFGFHAHASHFIACPDSLIPIPDHLDAETACFLPNTETAVNLVQDGAPILGERVLVLGQGVIGLLVASLLDRFPLGALVTADLHPIRRRDASETGRVTALDPGSPGFRQEALAHAAGPFDLAFELSGSPGALNDAIELTAFSGRIVIGSWYGEKRAALDLGGSFHRSRIRLIASQVSTIAPQLSGRWDRARRFDLAWRVLEWIRPGRWITHRVPLHQAAGIYHLLDERPQEAVQVLLTYPP